MNTPSKEALDASEAVQDYLGFPRRATMDLSAIIDRHFEPLRRDNATLAGRLTAAELERDSLGARAEQAEARVKELAGVLRRLCEHLPHCRLTIDCSCAFHAAEAILASHAAGEPAKPMMRDDPRYKGTSYGEAAKHSEVTP